jgi:type II secretory ATPase GspE/PulE/Tfp pilus assembly ATPase PilB-like protein
MNDTHVPQPAKETAPHEGRERYLDMVQRERQMLSEKGINRSLEQLLTAAGGYESSDNDTDNTLRDTATGDQLRSIVPVQAWLPLNVHLVGLHNGILELAPVYDLTERQRENLIATIRRCGFVVNDVEMQLWDRGELLEQMRRVHDNSAERCETTLSAWVRDLDNGLLLNAFVKDMISEALQLRASDIHILQDNGTDAPNWLKYRIDGDLVPMHLLPSDAMARLTTVLKRDAGLNFGDRRTPQDGRISFMWQGRNIDIRVASGPQGQDGEKLTMRLLDRAALKNFDDLFSRHPEVAEALKRMLDPQVKGDGGLILLSGPTGSGKSTTLYAAVQQIDRRRKHVLTIEDPIEYELRYATQWQVASGRKGAEFADLIRASMRHDPDYIVIGEMRDGETVETALKAAESGHTVMSTIHADSALQTLERLRSFMPPEKDRASTYTLAQQIRCILNQRLIKILCQGCAITSRAADVLAEYEMSILHLKPDDIVRRHNPNGCDICNRTGYYGRTLLLEALLVEGNDVGRNEIYKAMMTNTAEVAHLPGVLLFSRGDNIRKLVKEGYIDARNGLLQLQSLQEDDAGVPP